MCLRRPHNSKTGHFASWKVYKCTKMKNAPAKRAKLLGFLFNC